MSTGPHAPEDPTWQPTGRTFDLGPFAFFRVPPGTDPLRLDRWVQKNVCSGWHAAQKLISAKQVWIVPQQFTSDQHRGSIMIPRFRPETAGSQKIEPNQYIYYPKVMRPMGKRRIPTKPGSEREGWLLDRVLYKDTDFLAIDKPAGWAVHPGKHIGGMHLQRLLPTLRFGLDEDPRFVHRLSTEIGGVILLARHKAAAVYAKDMIRQRAFWQRAFWAVCCGRTPGKGTVALPLKTEQLRERNITKPCREEDGGLAALTEYSSVRYSPLGGGLSLVELNPYTGRYHQTRAHCAFGLRAPMVGDPIYYDMSNRLNSETEFKVHYHAEDAKRERAEVLGGMPELHLHSRQLRVKTFAGKDVLITAPLPAHMQRSFKNLGWGDYLKRQDQQAAADACWHPDDDPHVLAAYAEARTAEADRLDELAEREARKAGAEGLEPEPEVKRKEWRNQFMQGMQGEVQDEEVNDDEGGDTPRPTPAGRGRRSKGGRR